MERKLRITRALLELLSEARHPFALLTKSSGIERDLDLLVPLAQQGLAAVCVTLTTLDAKLARQLEPRAASPERRLRIVRTLTDAGITVGVSVGPQIPFLNEDMEHVLEAARQAGAQSAFYTVLRLPWELDPLFRQWLQLHYPQRAARIMARVQDLHGLTDAQRERGRSYSARFGQRFSGTGIWADLLRQRFEQTCARLGYRHGVVSLDTTQFRPPELSGQAELFV